MAEVSSSDGPIAVLRHLLAGRDKSLSCLLIMLFMEVGAFGMFIPVFPFFLINEIGFGATALVTTLLEVFAVRLIQGLSGGTAALCEVYTLDIVSDSDRASYMGISAAVKGISFVFGPGIGALLIFFGMSRRYIFLVCGVLALLAAVLGAIMLKESLESSKKRPLCGTERTDKTLGSTAADWEAFTLELVSVWFCRFASALGLGFLYATYAFLIKDNFGWNDFHFGMVLLVSASIGALIKLFLFARLVEVIGGPWVCVLGSAFGFAAFVILPEPSILPHLLGLFCLLTCGSFLEPAFPVLVGEFVGDRHLGFANGTVASWRSLATMLSPLLAGSMYELSPKHAYYTAAACFAGSGLCAATLVCLSQRRPELAAKGEETTRLLPAAA
eukprot:TRINITY_DN11828_c0_g1_i2.p1 TRINITY_DN11828_c0_g1~~TRINITY_DN11828_c0_g1_i2.p1  ORF type:complete len:386 (-),score=44.24 TRINITY_DN11828_c0_g1_i2:35-1192(-)